MADRFKRMVLAARPRGQVRPENFRLEEVQTPDLGEGEVLVRNHFLSLDPYMRGRMSEAKSYAAPQAIGETMIGATAGYVVASRSDLLAAGDAVTGMLGWAEYGVSEAAQLRKVDTARAPLSAYLGVLGMPGMTAWYGMHDILLPKTGETVLVSAASGAVGSAVGQLAKLAGCRAVGIAGGAAKCAYVVDELGFDACVDYKSEDFTVNLRAALPDGVDCLFENVGGEVLDQSLLHMNAFGRIALCGLIAGYSGKPLPVQHFKMLLLKRLSLRGFIVTEHMERWPQGLAELEQLVASGKLRYRETIADGLASAPQALIGLLQGANFGKQLVGLVQ
jgi:NADPH-dependent curcumin reductase CurA